ILRRYQRKVYRKLRRFGELLIAPDQREVIRENRKIILSEKEFKVLDILIRAKGKVCSTEAIFKKIWKASMEGNKNVVQATIRRLRKKIDRGFDRKVILSSYGVGYKLGID